ncbi:MAG TPA: large conductance mechanosensitive channel protein MscL [Clostridiales bacterium]|nr:large conductance mechanosensitive channel protein MscL [Clostridiales bacterium]
MWKDFKKFITKGNVIDLAVAVVIGAAFGAVVNGFVNDIIMPVIGYLISGVNFADLKIVLAAAVTEGEKVTPEVAIMYGHWLQVILQFLIIAFFVFLMVRSIAKMQKKKEEAPKPAAKPDDVVLLEEIRDLLKNK